jgi:hypothetical protein
MKSTPLFVSALAIVGGADVGAQDKERPAQTTVVTARVSGMSRGVCAGNLHIIGLSFDSDSILSLRRCRRDTR